MSFILFRRSAAACVAPGSSVSWLRTHDESRRSPIRIKRRPNCGLCPGGLAAPEERWYRVVSKRFHRALAAVFRSTNPLLARDAGDPLVLPLMAGDPSPSGPTERSASATDIAVALDPVAAAARRNTSDRRRRAREDAAEKRGAVGDRLVAVEDGAKRWQAWGRSRWRKAEHQHAAATRSVSKPSPRGSPGTSRATLEHTRGCFTSDIMPQQGVSGWLIYGCLP